MAESAVNRGAVGGRFDIVFAIDIFNEGDAADPPIPVPPCRNR